MKNNLPIFTFVFTSILLFCNAAFSQTVLTKPEKKALKKEIKNLKKHPEIYKDNKDNTAKKIAEQEAEIESLKAQLTTEWGKVDSLKTAVTEAEQTIAEFEKSNIECGKVPSQGTVYSVQIGNFKNLDLRSIFNVSKGLRTENYTGGNAYLIGNFITVEEAIQFDTVIKKLGITNAFVTQYIDGTRNVTFKAIEEN